MVAGEALDDAEDGEERLLFFHPCYSFHCPPLKQRSLEQIIQLYLYLSRLACILMQKYLFGSFEYSL